jgi:hypothetical protein
MARNQYIMRQITTLLKFARTTTDPKIAAAVVEKATNLQNRAEETMPRLDLGPRAPDIEST